MASSVLPRVGHGYPADRPSRRAEQRDDRRRTHLIKVVGNGDFGHETDPRCRSFVTNRNDSRHRPPIPRDDEFFVHQAGQVGLGFVHVDDPNHFRNPSSPRPIGLVCLVYLACGSPPSGAWPLRHHRDSDRSDPGSATPVTAAACPLRRTAPDRSAQCARVAWPSRCRTNRENAAGPTARTLPDQPRELGQRHSLAGGSPCWQYSQLHSEYVQGHGLDSRRLARPD
jgi:hypothetical protein